MWLWKQLLGNQEELLGNLSLEAECLQLLWLEELQQLCKGL